MDSLHRKKILFLAQAAFALLWLSWSPTIYAQVVPESQPLQTVDVQAELQNNGSVNITQVLTYFSPAPLDWKIFSNYQDLKITANKEAEKFTKKKANGGTQVNSNTLSKSWKLEYRTTSVLQRFNNRDQFFIRLVEEPLVPIDQIKLTFKLPPDAKGVGLIGNVYSIGGVGLKSTSAPSPNTIEFTIDSAGPSSIVTINTHWPKSVLQLNSFQEWRLTLANLEILPWLFLGILLPVLSLIILLYLMAKRKHGEPKVKEISPTLPNPVSPLIVGTLVDKKVYPKEIVAMLIDLCRRGYIVIVKKSGQYYLSQRRPIDDGLEHWEKDILSEIFPISNRRLTKEEMKELNRASLFSPKVRDAFSSIYEVVTTKKYFAENPHTTRVRLKLAALFFYFISLASAIWTAVTASSPYLLLPLFGTILVAYSIIRLCPSLVRYTESGLQARHDWLSFGNFLGEEKPLPLEASQNNVFEKYLGYAVALNKTEKWARRFDLSKTVIVRPDWFITYEDTSTVEFAFEIEKFSRSISEMLSEMRGPLVN